MFLKILSYIIFTFAIRSSMSEAKCLNQLFIQENQHYTPTKKEMKIRIPGYSWKNYLLNQHVAEDMHETVDWDKYQLMLHAVHYRTGVKFYRICEKNTEYPSYGQISIGPLEGYRIKTDKLFTIDRLLYAKHFDTLATSAKKINDYYHRIEEEKKAQFEKDNPWIAYFYNGINTVIFYTFVFTVNLVTYGVFLICPIVFILRMIF